MENNAYKIVSGKPQTERLATRPRIKLEDTIKTDLKKTVW